ncbi:MAG: hypothetical protein MPN21_27170 [Thermoanaerobaculia bacterium]|nr:hypothetical protein [Thermoanaerobaculia bacterium]
MTTAFATVPAGRPLERSATQSPIGWRRLITSSTSHLVLYFVVGMTIYPQIEEYYSTQHIPSLTWLIALQLVRGALYVIFVLGLLRGLTLGRRATSLSMALMFPSSRGWPACSCQTG